VLVRGESGTGKELVAETIHRLSSRRDAPLLAVNCGAISPNLTESELFGHERGSFTGADRQRLGLFERAHTGTLFLDEITEMPPELQVKLLRVLETGSVVRVGGAAPIAVDVRIVAATNRDPVEAVRSGQLREDLFYRLNVFPVELPPLRERAGDVEVLAEHFLAALNQEAGTSKRFARAALERMRRHSWPGNVRELANAVQRAFILGDEEIGADGLPEVQPSAPEPSDRLVLHVRIGAPIVEVERRLILATLESVGGDKKQAAALLGISLKTLYNRLNVYAAALGAPVAARPAGDDSGS
jgi:transcriptional regulator with PAS, ATPase and Fis domain